MWKLVIEDDEGKRTVVPLTRDEYTIGRKEGNSIRLTERNVSRDHAKLTKRPGPTKDKPIFTLGDMTSYNGVYVNGLRVADRQELAHGDLIQIGDYRVVLQDEAIAASPPDEEPLQIETDEISEVKQAPTAAPLRATNATFLEKPNRLVVLAGPNPGEEFPLVGERLTIGRAEDATISVNHNSVSRLHCEVHSLGEGRFEIVDKGSSNGVRVNGADLRRGIIEAGDVIELGDVKFKFVGEGQLFRPGTNESQQLAAISARSATEVIQVRSRKSALVPTVAVGTLLALIFIVVYALKGRAASVDPPSVGPVTSAAPSSTGPVDTTGADAAMLADARRMCEIGDVEGAHQKASQLPAGSPLHTSDDFKYIEVKWTMATFMQSDSEQDPAAKEALLKRLIGDTYADPTVRKTASDRLSALEAAASAPAGHDAGKHGSTASSSTSPHTSASPGGRTSPASDTPPPSRPIRSAPPPSQTLQDLATSPNPADWQKARDILDPKVFGRRGASPEDMRLLKAICKNQHDQQCVTELAHLQ